MAQPAAAATRALPAAVPSAVVNLIRDPGAENAKPNSAGGKVTVAGWDAAGFSRGPSIAAPATSPSTYTAASALPDLLAPGEERP